MIKGTCTQKGIVFKKRELIKTLGTSGFRNLKSRLTITKTKRMGNRYNTREEKLYMEFDSPAVFIIARFTLDVLRDVFKKYAPKTKWRLENKIPKGEDIPPERLVPGPTLDNNQQIISDYLDETIYNDKKIRSTRSSRVLVMKTGLGKTYVGAGKIREIKKKTLIIVPSKSVMGEWQKALSTCYPKLCIGNYLQKTDGDVVIMVVNTATKDIINVKMPISTKNTNIKTKITKIKYFDYFKRFGFVIYDEIHNYTSPVKQKALWRTNMSCCLGLTATPSADAWEMDIIFQKHVGPLIFAEKIPGFNAAQISWKGVYKPVMYHGPPEYTRTIKTPATGWTSHPKMINQFASDPYRTIVLLNLLKQLQKRKRNVFVFFKTRDFADTIQSLLLKYILNGKFEKINSQTTKYTSLSEKNNSQMSTVLMGGATEDDKQNAMESSIVLTTYGYGWQGVSIPKMDTLVFATPRMAKMEQIVGRILRKSGNTDITREIWDIIDIETELGKKEYTIRKKSIATVVDFTQSPETNISYKTVKNLEWVTAEVFDYVSVSTKPDTFDTDDFEI